MNQSGKWIPSVAVRAGKTRECREAMQICKTRAIDVDGEHRPVAEGAAFVSGPIERVTRQHQSRIWQRTVVVGGVDDSVEAVQSRECLCQRLRLQQAKTCQQCEYRKPI